MFLVDFHKYSTPSWFTGNAFMWDTYPRNDTQWFVGEYAGASKPIFYRGGYLDYLQDEIDSYLYQCF